MPVPMAATRSFQLETAMDDAARVAGVMSSYGSLWILFYNDGPETHHMSTVFLVSCSRKRAVRSQLTWLRTSAQGFFDQKTKKNFSVWAPHWGRSGTSSHRPGDPNSRPVGSENTKPHSYAGATASRAAKRVPLPEKKTQMNM